MTCGVEDEKLEEELDVVAMGYKPDNIRLNRTIQ